jgi:hypothetical protein
LLLDDGNLERCDIARANLLAAEGLPGTEAIDLDRSQRKLDAMARRVAQCMNPAAFEKRPEHWDSSFNLFRTHVLVSVLQREFAVRYNPAKVSVDVPFDIQDSFIHGVLDGPGGTCGTLPVVLIAVGRRLGYPLSLVHARGEKYGHSFARWDEPNGERFNIELGPDSFACPPDGHYRTGSHAQGRYRTKPEWEARGIVLKSNTRREELAAFMATRSVCWDKLGNGRRAAEAMAWATAFAPRHDYARSLGQLLRKWLDRLTERMPPGFPRMRVFDSPTRYPPTLPRDAERHLRMQTALEFLLDDPEHERQWWGPMRRRAALPYRLTCIYVEQSDDRYRIEMHSSKATT